MLFRSKSTIEKVKSKFPEEYNIQKRNEICGDTEKKEESEGVGAYAAPAFEMEPDHVHFKHQYNESKVIDYVTENYWKQIETYYLKKREEIDL